MAQLGHHHGLLQTEAAAFGRPVEHVWAAHAVRAAGAMLATLRARSTAGSSVQQHGVPEPLLLPLLHVLIELAALIPQAYIVYECMAVMTDVFYGPSGAVEGHRHLVDCRPGGDGQCTRDDAVVFSCRLKQGRGVTPLQFARLMPPMLTMLVPAVLHTLQLSTQDSLAEYRILHHNGNEQQAANTRFLVLNNLTNFVLTVMTAHSNDL